MSKQETKSLLPSFKERHTPGYNFNGPGTKIAERIALTYKGKVGTKTFWLPKNKLDYEAFKHDLRYYSLSKPDHILADMEYVKNTEAGISKVLIASQLRTRQFHMKVLAKITKDPDKLAAITRGATIGLESEVQKVVSKYDAYLRTVGHFNKDGDFVIKAPPEDSIQAYNRFYDSFKSYVEWTNNKFKLEPGFKPEVVPELNTKKKDVLLYKPMSTPETSGKDGKKEVVEVEVPVSPSKDGKKEVSDMTSVSKEEFKDIIRAAYSDIISKGDINAYEDIIAAAEISPERFRVVASILNEKRPFLDDSPFTVKDIKSLKLHLGAVSHIEGHSNAVPEDIMKEASGKLNAYIATRDPVAKDWVITAGIPPGALKKNGKGFKKGISLKNGKKIVDAIDRRLGILGLPPVKIDGKRSKKNIGEFLSRFDMKDLNFYSGYPHLEAAGMESKIQAAIESDERHRSAKTTKGIMSELTGKTSAEIVRDRFQRIIEETQASRLLEVKGDEIIYKPVPYFKPGMADTDVKETFQRMVADTVQQIKIQNRLVEIKDKQEFRENTPLGRLSMLRKAVKDTPDSKDLTEEAIIALNDDGYLAALQNIIKGKPGKSSPSSIMNALDQIPLVSDAQFDQLRKLIKDYDTHVLPDIKDGMEAAFKATVDKPADIRVLPKGVSVQPIDVAAEAKKTMDKKVDIEMKKQRLTEIKEEKKTATPDEMKVLLGEESELLSDVIAAKKTTVKPPKNTRDIIKKAGALRPHLRNPTASAVAKEISETPEQQARDFTNWFVFDIPTDQTGVGSAIKNPLVEQNAARERFMGEGTLFKHFNQTYELTGGVEERKQFYTQHSRLFKEGVDRGLLTRKQLSEEEAFLGKFNSNSNGLFAQDQAKSELNHWHSQYQTPNDYFGGVMYPLQKTTNPSIFMSDFEKNTNLFPAV